VAFRPGPGRPAAGGTFKAIQITGHSLEMLLRGDKKSVACKKQPPKKVKKKPVKALNVLAKSTAEIEAAVQTTPLLDDPQKVKQPPPVKETVTQQGHIDSLQGELKTRLAEPAEAAVEITTLLNNTLLLDDEEDILLTPRQGLFETLLEYEPSSPPAQRLGTLTDPHSKYSDADADCAFLLSSDAAELNCSAQTSIRWLRDSALASVHLSNEQQSHKLLSTVNELNHALEQCLNLFKPRSASMF
jgi:hypothetical protein